MKIIQLGHASLQAIYNKFHSFEKMEELNPNNFFDRFYLFILRTKEGNRLKLGNNVEVYEFKRRKLPHILHILKVLIFLFFWVKTKGIDIIHAKDPYNLGFIALILSKLTNIPFCVSIHADYDQRYKITSVGHVPVYFGSRKIAKMLERFVLSRCPVVLPIRESLGEYAIRSGARKETIRVIPHGIDLSPFEKPIDSSVKSNLAIENKAIISFVGRLSKENYVYDILAIANDLKKLRGGDFIMLIVGDGSERNNMEKIIKEENMEDVVKLTGYQPYEIIPEIRKISNINLCLMAGFSLIEACASGRPVVAYDVEWHYELVKDGETGFLIKEGNVNSAVKKINYLLNNPDVAKKMGENVKRLAFERHSIEKTSEIKVKWYKELIEKYGRD
ncbi:D-inositol-3-phosphate glycosyltransferase [subsurface metagenome]